MVLERGQRREIDGKGRTVRELLVGRRYAIDYHQREYKWQTRQVTELLRDLTAKFLDRYEPHHERSDVADYGHYSGRSSSAGRKAMKFIIDAAVTADAHSGCDSQSQSCRDEWRRWAASPMNARHRAE